MLDRELSASDTSRKLAAATRVPRPASGSPAYSVGGSSLGWRPRKYVRPFLSLLCVFVFGGSVAVGDPQRWSPERSDATLGMSGTTLFVNIWKTRQNHERHWPFKLLNLASWKPHGKIPIPRASAKLAPNADDPMSLPIGWGCANSASRAYDILRRRENNWPKREGVKCRTEAPHFRPRSGDLFGLISE